MEEVDAPVVDVVFGLAGTSVPAEHALDLWRATLACLPWLEHQPAAGIHPLRTSPSPGGDVLLAHRAKLVLRVPRERAADALGLAGRALAVGGRRLDVGAGTLRPLRAWGTLHAQHVALGIDDGARFQDDVAHALAAMRVDCGFITGWRRTQNAGGREIVGFSVALTGLRPDESLRVQCEGIGSDRALGWGIFVPHKSIAAV